MGKQSTRENKTIYQLCQEEKERMKKPEIKGKMRVKMQFFLRLYF